MKSSPVSSTAAASLESPARAPTRPAPGAGGKTVKAPDSEKITINLGHVDLGQVDLLVNEGFYGNRTDFIRTAIRNQLSQHADVMKQVVARKMFVFGMQHISRHDLEQLQEARQKLTLRVVGLATIATDVTPELALATIDTLEVLGALHASSAVKQALATRIQ